MLPNMASYVVYDEIGRIIRIVECSPNMKSMQKRRGEFIMEGKASLTDHMVSGGEVVEKPENPIVLTGTTFMNVPVPSKMTIGSDTYDITSTTVELDLPLAGRYIVKFESFPCKDKSFVVIVS